MQFSEQIEWVKLFVDLWIAKFGSDPKQTSSLVPFELPIRSRSGELESNQNGIVFKIFDLKKALWEMPENGVSPMVAE